MITAPRLHRSRTLWLAVVVTLLSAACSVEQATPYPHCQSGDSGLITAQSVPTADLIPCLDSVPDGWKAANVAIGQDGTVVRFDSDRAGAGAARLEYRDACDIGDAVSVPDDQEDAAAFEYIERLEPGLRSEKYYVFHGGCAWWTFDFDDDVSAVLAVELDDRLTLLSRDALNENIAESFIDEEL